MGLAAFNRMREQRRIEQDAINKQNNEEAAEAFNSLFPLEREAPGFVEKAIEATKRYLELTSEQLEIVGGERIEELHIAILGALETKLDTMVVNESVNDPKDDEATETGDEPGEKPSPDTGGPAAKPGGDNPQGRARGGKAG